MCLPGKVITMDMSAGVCVLVGGDITSDIVGPIMEMPIVLALHSINQNNDRKWTNK